jgi:hypothetical protein
VKGKHLNPEVRKKSKKQDLALRKKQDSALRKKSKKQNPALRKPNKKQDLALRKKQNTALRKKQNLALRKKQNPALRKPNKKSKMQNPALRKPNKKQNLALRKKADRTGCNRSNKVQSDADILLDTQLRFETHGGLGFASPQKVILLCGNKTKFFIKNAKLGLRCVSMAKRTRWRGLPCFL